MNRDNPLLQEPRRHAIGRGWVWIRTGFDIFNKGMGVSVAMTLIWFGTGLLLDKLPAGSLISQLLYMVWGAGWVAVARRGYEGDGLQLSDLFAGFRHRLTPLMLGGLLVLALFGLIVVICLGLLHLWGLNGILTQGLDRMSPAQVQGLILCLLLGLALMVPVLMAITFAPALIFFHEIGIWQAARLSFKGCLVNMWPFFWWGLIGAVLMLFGAALMLVGLLVVMPAINYSIYVAYRDIYLDERAVPVDEPTFNDGGFDA